MIAVTGAAGFIASVVAGTLNRNGFEDLVLVDDFSKTQKKENYSSKKYNSLIDRNEFIEWFEKHHDEIDFIIHLGARTDTTEFDYNVFQELNVDYTLAIWKICTEHQIPMIYASSAATYGMGESGYIDSHDIVNDLQPLNAYGRSKNEIDKWILQQKECPPFWAGLKFFNVYGPNEYHKGRMASVILHSFGQINTTGQVKLFRSHRPDYKDGQQLRDFVYVKDVANVILWLMQHKPESGLYNVGTGKARSFYDLADNTFKALRLKTNIEFIDTPLDIRDKYQYFTEAKMDKLRKAGYDKPFTSLEDGVYDYVTNYLIGKRYF
ncbi:MAG: ADP-glyceromanno-heptose 6-epimerase [Bacteroidales bacterium]|nr:ADP-glyceromanno-heptose 6-epimerase [Bacteroidales bacterium]